MGHLMIDGVLDSPIHEITWLGHRVDGDRMSAPDPEILNSSLFYMVRRVRTKLVVSVRNKLGHPTALLDPR